MKIHVESYISFACSIARKVTRDDEATGIALLTLVKVAKRYRGSQETFRAYLAQSIRRAVYRYLKRERRKYQGDPAPILEGLVQEEKSPIDVGAVLNRMGKEGQLLFDLIKFDGCVNSLRSRYNISERTLRRKIQAARETLWRMLAE